MTNIKEQELSAFLDKRPEFKGKFLGQHKDGLVSRIDDRWYSCNCYLIEFNSLMEVLMNQPSEKKLLGEFLSSLKDRGLIPLDTDFDWLVWDFLREKNGIQEKA